MTSEHRNPDTTNSETGHGPTAQLLDHEYDGIREYDNPLPRWWVAIFWGSFWFALGYFFYFHLSGTGTSIAQGYAEEMRAVAAEQGRRALAEKVSEESLTTLMQN